MDAVVRDIIQKALKKYPRAKKIAVTNFLATATSYTFEVNVANAEYDKLLYKWNDSTYYAILFGLNEMLNKGIIKYR